MLQINLPEIDYNKDYCSQFDRNEKILFNQDKEAKKNNTLVGRLIKQPFADGYAHYVITKVLKNEVEAKVVTNIGDDWVIPYWGKNAKIKKDYVVNLFKAEEAHNDFLQKHQ